jgi:hypothetical protein
VGVGVGVGVAAHSPIGHGLRRRGGRSSQHDGYYRRHAEQGAAGQLRYLTGRREVGHVSVTFPGNIPHRRYFCNEAAALGLAVNT